MGKINERERVDIPGYIIILRPDHLFYRTFAEKYRMLSHAVNIPPVHVKNDVGGISVDDKVARN